MHFAYPPRKSSNPPPYAPRTARLPLLRRSRIQLFAGVALAVIFLIWLFSGPSKPTERVISGKPPVVIVTAFDDPSDHPDYIHAQKENRLQYAEKHGYATVFVRTQEYDLGGSPPSWTRVVAMRHALTKFPNCKYLWYLDQDSFIMNPNIKLEDDILKSSVLQEIIKKDIPIVPPDSIIKTFSHVKADDVDFILTQDDEGLSARSFVVRNGDWAKFFLDTWFDPLYRSYNFQRAETHALEHIVQWHPTILSKLGVIPQRSLNAYDNAEHGEKYQEGDFTVRLASCSDSKSCWRDAEPFNKQWQKAFASSR